MIDNVKVRKIRRELSVIVISAETDILSVNSFLHLLILPFP